MAVKTSGQFWPGAKTQAVVATQLTSKEPQNAAISGLPTGGSAAIQDETESAERSARSVIAELPIDEIASPLYAVPANDHEPRMALSNVPGWVVLVDDGRQIPLTGRILVGRNPQGRPGEEAAQLVKISDDTEKVSQTHLALDLNEDGVFLVDRGSTNGSVVTSPRGARTLCSPEDAVLIAEGSVVSFGDHWLEVMRSSGAQP